MNRIAILAVVCVVVFCACQETHDDKPLPKAATATPSGTLQGTWRLRSLTVGEASPLDSNAMMQMLVGLLFSSNTVTCVVKGDSVYTDSTSAMKYATADGKLTLYNRNSTKEPMVAKYGIFGDSLVLSDVADGSTMLSFKRR